MFIRPSRRRAAVPNFSISALFTLAALVVTISTLAIQRNASGAATSSIVVNTLADETTPGDGLCSLREAILNANSRTDVTGGDCLREAILNANSRTDVTGGDCAAGTGTDQIAFDLGGTIFLSSQLPAITNTLTINGAGQSVTVDGANLFRAFEVNQSASLEIDSLSIAHGYSALGYGNAGQGGAIYNE